MTDPTIIFHHLPKTAGSTILSILSREYRGKKVYQIDGLETDSDIGKFRVLSQDRKNKYDMIMGHQALLLYNEIERYKIVFSFFRKPFEQFISSYYYLKSAAHNKHSKIVSKLTLDEYFLYTIKMNLTNPQSKLLFNANYEDIFSADLILSKSAEAFKKIDIPCLIESFDMSLMCLKRILGWKKQPYYTIKNKSKSDLNRINGDLQGKHYEVNYPDYKIYQMAKQKFYQLCNDQDYMASRKFKKINSLYALISRVLKF